MKSIIWLVLAAVLLINTEKLWANDGYKDHKVRTAVQSAQKTPEASSAVEVGNKICPVSGEKIGTMGEAVHYEHEGKVYNFCCPMCVKDFKKDPQKYIKILEEKGELNTPSQEENADHQHKH